MQFSVINDGQEPEKQHMGLYRAWTVLMRADKWEVVCLIAPKGRDLKLCVFLFSFY